MKVQKYVVFAAASSGFDSFPAVWSFSVSISVLLQFSDLLIVEPNS